MSQYDWSKFSQKIYIKAPMQRVYDAWATPANLESWFLRKAEFKTPDGVIKDSHSQVLAGDTYEWMWHGHPDTIAEHGVVIEANGKDRFRFTFGNAGVVTVQLTDHGDMTEMLLTQDQIPSDEEGKVNYHIGCSNGWTYYRVNMKSVLEGGLDLRNKSTTYSNAITDENGIAD
jgi:uncharacterized protein YndB with AHSA1/START domain